MNLSFQDPQKAVSYLFHLSLNSKTVSKMLKPLGWLTLQSHRYKQKNLSRYKFWSNHFCTLCTEALGSHPSQLSILHKIKRQERVVPCCVNVLSWLGFFFLIWRPNKKISFQPIKMHVSWKNQHSKFRFSSITLSYYKH